jgi:hypothetical protein
MVASFSARAGCDFCESGRQLASFYLSATAFRNLLHDPHSGRDLKTCQAFAREASELLYRQPGARTQYDGSGDVSAKSCVGNSESGGFNNVRMVQQGLFDLARRDFLPAAIDDLLDPPDNEQIALRVQVPKVAGSEPAVLKGRAGGGGVIVVSPRDVWAP